MAHGRDLARAGVLLTLVLTRTSVLVVVFPPRDPGDLHFRRRPKMSTVPLALASVTIAYREPLIFLVLAWAVPIGVAPPSWWSECRFRGRLPNAGLRPAAWCPRRWRTPHPPSETAARRGPSVTMDG